MLVFIGRPASSAAPSFATPAASASGAVGDAIVDDVSSEATLPSIAPSATSFADAALAVDQQPDGAILVDLNHASEDDLRKLPGVGPHKAKAIVELRPGRMATARSRRRSLVCFSPT